MTLSEILESAKKQGFLHAKDELKVFPIDYVTRVHKDDKEEYLREKELISMVGRPDTKFYLVH
jgi:hypothetical protein